MNKRALRETYAPLDGLSFGLLLTALTLAGLLALVLLERSFASAELGAPAAAEAAP